MPYDCIDLNLRLKRIPYFSLVDKQSEKKKESESNCSKFTAHRTFFANNSGRKIV